MERDNYLHRKSRFNRNDQNSRRDENDKRTLRDSYLNENCMDYFKTNPILQPMLPMINPMAFAESYRQIVSPQGYRATPQSSESDDFAFRFNSLNLDDSFTGRMSPNSPIGMKSSNFARMNRLTTLPPWCLDENREIRSDLTLDLVVEKDLLICFATDKSGCHFLQSNFYGEKTQNISPKLRDRICQEVLSERAVFLTLCKNIFGNFFLQRVIEYSKTAEQDIIRKYINSDISVLCLDKSACRVVQTALEKLKPRFADSLVESIPRDRQLMSICTDQNANHVIQKIVKKMQLRKWEFLVTFLCNNDEDHLLDICQDKYGCRVVQTVVEVLSSSNSRCKEDRDDKVRVLRKLMGRILSRCQKLASNEFANYVIQHIIETPGILGEYRDAIIEKCLLRSLLSLSQEKYASHVVERAFTFAPLPYLTEMMEEIFDGYVPHPETGKDALDILIFHQFGNYVVQRMLEICCEAVVNNKYSGMEYQEKFEGWLAKLYVRAKKERSRLMRFSSGKKIIEILQKMGRTYDFATPLESFHICDNASSMFTPSTNTTNTTSNEWTSRRNSFSSDHQEFDFNFNSYHNNKQ